MKPASQFQQSSGFSVPLGAARTRRGWAARYAQLTDPRAAVGARHLEPSALRGLADASCPQPCPDPGCFCQEKSPHLTHPPMCLRSSEASDKREPLRLRVGWQSPRAIPTQPLPEALEKVKRPPAPQVSLESVVLSDMSKRLRPEPHPLSTPSGSVL
ncbi:unnamed protein product [Rangifer tarandus platyrhynchus]|uniref:Uncharacterized protein n=1 Tax=Rangifer tarandus platyrhynchus TaxID=3082113 RepID=A0ABN8YGV9_RANTA|nr:unnamed protein product [Rangifer tarandus platyrhynchus]